MRYFAISVLYFGQRYNLLGSFSGYPSAPDVLKLLEATTKIEKISISNIQDFAVQEIGQLDYEAALSALKAKEYESK